MYTNGHLSYLFISPFSAIYMYIDSNTHTHTHKKRMHIENHVTTLAIGHKHTSTSCVIVGEGLLIVLAMLFTLQVIAYSMQLANTIYVKAHGLSMMALPALLVSCFLF